eukprot:3085641-Amphidinium_carterae.1
MRYRQSGRYRTSGCPGEQDEHCGMRLLSHTPRCACPNRSLSKYPAAVHSGVAIEPRRSHATWNGSASSSTLPVFKLSPNSDCQLGTHMPKVSAACTATKKAAMIHLHECFVKDVKCGYPTRLWLLCCTSNTHSSITKTARKANAMR